MSKIQPVVTKTPEALAEAIGVSQSNARQWRVQYVLLNRLRGIIERDRFANAEIAERAGITQEQVAAILKGADSDVSSDLLIRMIASLGYKISVSVSREDTAA